MNNKKIDRRKPYNKFRYYPLYQRRTEKKLQNGDYINDYKNIDVYPCDRRILNSFESNLLETRNIASDTRLDGRYPWFEFKNGDRFLFLDFHYTGSKVLPTDILYMSHFQDRTGRKEYGEFLCRSEDFTSLATRGEFNPLVFAKSTVFVGLDDSLTLPAYGDIDFIERKSFSQKLIKNIQTFTNLDFNLPSYSAPQGIIRSYDPVSHIIQFDRDIGQRVSLFITSTLNVGLYLLESLDPDQFTYRVDADLFTNEFPNDTFSPDEEIIVNLEDENLNFLEFQTPLYLTFFEDISSVQGTGIETKSTFNFTKINSRQFVTESDIDLLEITVSL